MAPPPLSSAEATTSLGRNAWRPADCMSLVHFFLVSLVVSLSVLPSDPPHKKIPLVSAPRQRASPPPFQCSVPTWFFIGVLSLTANTFVAPLERPFSLLPMFPSSVCFRTGNLLFRCLLPGHGNPSANIDCCVEPRPVRFCFIWFHHRTGSPLSALSVIT